MTDEAVIARIREVLEQAERGEVISVAIATLSPDLSTGSAFILGGCTLAELLGSIDLMKHRMMRLAEGRTVGVTPREVLIEAISQNDNDGLYDGEIERMADAVLLRLRNEGFFVGPVLATSGMRGSVTTLAEGGGLVWAEMVSAWLDESKVS